jgi:hypothetical protein
MSLEYPVIAIFFLWAGAGLHIRALGDIGLLFAVYVVARLVGKLAGPLLTALIMRNDQEHSRRFLGLGMSLVPQAGAAVGLAILARDMLPESGETILVAVLAAVVVFELVGPVGVHWAARHVGEAQVASDDEPLTLSEAISELKNRRPVVAVVLCPESDPSLLQMPRLLAARLGADLLLVPVSDAAVAPPASWAGALSSEGAKGPRREDETTISGGREMVVDTVPVENGSAERLVSLLVDSKPAVVLLAPEGLPGCVLEVADELSHRLDCPVFKIPEPEIARRRRLWSARGLAEVVGRSRIARRLRGIR